MPSEPQTRTVVTPTLGTKICLLIALLFLVVATYFYFVPITGVRTTTGGVFGCGTAAHPSTGNFAVGTCGRIADSYKYRAFAALAMALVLLVIGTLCFGVDRRQETRRVPSGGDGDDAAAGATGAGAQDPSADRSEAAASAQPRGSHAAGDDQAPAGDDEAAGGDDPTDRQTSDPTAVRPTGRRSSRHVRGT